MNATSKVAILVGCLALGGCLGDGNDQLALNFPGTTPAAPAVAPEATLNSGRSVATIPWQLTPASAASRAQGEETFVENDPKLGPVRGTKVALANLDRQMVAYSAPRVTVDACEKVLAPQAIKEGAYSVEAAPAGPVKALRNGVKSQQVLFRILYKTPEGVEIRQHSLDCQVTRSNKVLAASPV